MKKLRFPWLACMLALGLIAAMFGCNSEPGDTGTATNKVYTVNIPATPNGTVTADPTEGTRGTLITVTTTPDPGYELATLRFNGTSFITTKTFKMPGADVNINAAFEEIWGNDGIPPFNYNAWKGQLEAWRAELRPIIAAMTPREKYGQMTQAEYDHVAPRLNASGTIVAGNDVRDWFLGSVLSGGHSGPRSDGSGSMASAAEWVQYTNLLVRNSMEARLKIPVIYGQDDMHGASKEKNSTILPHNVGLGAIAVGGGMPVGRAAGYAAGKETGEEMLAGGIRWTFGPVLGVPYDIRWGRTYECFSENVGIVRAMGPAVIRGLYDGGVSPSSKHFGPEGQTANGANGGNATITIDAYKDIVRPYKAAIEAGVMCIMASYGSRNGLKIHEDRELLTDLLKGELGFEGMIITDWDSISSVSGATYADKLAQSINAGVDMVMAASSVANWQGTVTGLEAMVDANRIPQSRIDDAVMRILLFKKAIPRFWNAYGHDGTAPTQALDEQISPMLSPGTLHSDSHKAVAVDLVEKSLVLLKNEGNTVQNLKNASKVLLVGTGADDVGLACGGWTVGWQGAAGEVTDGETIREALVTLKGAGNVYYNAAGTNVTLSDFDAVIAVISETPYAEGSGDVTGTVVKERSGDANVLANAITVATNAGKPLVLIIYSGRPLNLENRVDGAKPEAVVAAWLPGSEAGTGIVNVLFKDEKDFVGKTAFTWRRTAPDGDVLYPYGHGLRKNNN